MKPFNNIKPFKHIEFSRQTELVLERSVSLVSRVVGYSEENVQSFLDGNQEGIWEQYPKLTQHMAALKDLLEVIAAPSPSPGPGPSPDEANGEAPSLSSEELARQVVDFLRNPLMSLPARVDAVVSVLDTFSQD